jgi:hypothetical protein
MSQLIENSMGKLVQQLSKHTKFSTQELKGIISKLPADSLINLKAAADLGKMNQMQRILQTVAPEPKQLGVEAAKQKILSLERDSKLSSRGKIKEIISIISELSVQQWKLIWPTMDENTLLALSHQSSKTRTTAVGRKQADEILKYAKEQVMEKLIYQNQIVEVKIAHGPNNTVGIMLDEKLTMVPRNECQSLNEHVLGMTGMPSLARMMALAGVDTLPEESSLIRADKLPVGMRVVVEFDPDRPMDNTRVRILNVDATTTLEGLRLRIKRQFQELSADLTSASPDYDFATSNAKKLSNSLETMQAALHDIAVIRRLGGAKTRNIPQVLEDETY